MRIDILLNISGMAQSRTEAQKMIDAGTVFISGRQVKKASEECDDVSLVKVDGFVKEFVSRGGLKLAKAIETFGISVDGAVALDVGASTGGFTDCLLRHGAKKVFAVDSGHGQLVPELASDSRVVNIEGLNARAIKPDDIGETVSVITMDVSFISQTCIIPSLVPLCKSGAVFISLIKPQFEAGREYVGRGGIVKSDVGHRRSVERVLNCAAEVGFEPIGVTDSPITGGDGNREYLGAFRLCERVPVPIDLQKLLNGVGL